jgi:hypothetical protein
MVRKERQREFYYLRRWGLPGRVVLGYESASPALGPLKDPLEERVLVHISGPIISSLEAIDRFLPKEEIE